MSAGREAAKRTLQQVRPVLSVNKDEARRRVLNLYKAWSRSIPVIGWSHFKFAKISRIIDSYCMYLVNDYSHQQRLRDPPFGHLFWSTIDILNYINAFDGYFG